MCVGLYLQVTLHLNKLYPTWSFHLKYAIAKPHDYNPVLRQMSIYILTVEHAGRARRVIEDEEAGLLSIQCRVRAVGRRAAVDHHLELRHQRTRARRQRVTNVVCEW